jgi:cytochrome P450
MISALREIGGALAEMAVQRRRRPREGFITALIDAEVDGARLTDDEIVNFLTLLVAGGADTTKQAISHTMGALSEYPDSKRALIHDFDGLIDTAVEEMPRWATVAPALKRTAACDVELGGQTIRAGEKVVLFTKSANRDETVFPEPWTFDIRRSPNRHVAFGGGAHHCLGAALARMELRVMFRELLTRLPDIESGAIDYGDTSHIDTIRALPVHF